MEDQMASRSPNEGHSPAFVDVRNLVVGYVVGYLLTISENKFVLVR